VSVGKDVAAEEAFGFGLHWFLRFFVERVKCGSPAGSRASWNSMSELIIRVVSIAVVAVQRKAISPFRLRLHSGFSAERKSFAACLPRASASVNIYMARRDATLFDLLVLSDDFLALGTGC
jgi:hypothetical protein